MPVYHDIMCAIGPDHDWNLPKIDAKNMDHIRMLSSLGCFLNVCHVLDSRNFGEGRGDITSTEKEQVSAGCGAFYTLLNWLAEHYTVKDNGKDVLLLPALFYVSSVAVCAYSG